MAIELIILPKDTLVYRSYTENTKRDGYWFALKEQDTYGYGDKTAVYILKRDLKLIDITKKSFYETLKQFVANDSIVLPDFKNVQSSILFPLGFEDGVFYRDFAKLCGVDHNAYVLNPLIHSESQLHFNNRSRLSIMQHDIELMKFLKRHLGTQADGIVSLKPFPDIIRNGYQSSEMSVFDSSFVEYIHDAQRAVTGGSSENSAPIFIQMEGNEKTREMTKMSDEIYRKMDEMQLNSGNIGNHIVKTYDIYGNLINSSYSNNHLHAPIFIQMEGNEKVKEMTKMSDEIYKKMDDMGIKPKNNHKFIVRDINGNIIKSNKMRKTLKNTRK